MYCGRFDDAADVSAGLGIAGGFDPDPDLESELCCCLLSDVDMVCLYDPPGNSSRFDASTDADESSSGKAETSSESISDVPSCSDGLRDVYDALESMVLASVSATMPRTNCGNDGLIDALVDSRTELSATDALSSTELSVVAKLTSVFWAGFIVDAANGCDCSKTLDCCVPSSVSSVDLSTVASGSSS